jgi:cytochrome c oxidase assembly protein subunit 15
MKRPERSQVLWWARASVIINIAIVFTGGLVRLTASGLGCPTWPKCTAQTWTAHKALGVHGAIEFGNRLLTGVLVAVAVGTLLVVVLWVDARLSQLLLAIGLVVGIPLQAVIGGLTVLTHLNPWLVSLHLVLSMVLIAAAAVLVHSVGGGASTPVSAASRAIIWLIAVVGATVIYLGTMVTGSGPHAGDAQAPRNGLDPLGLSHVHAAAVYGLIALTLLGLALLWRTSARPAALAVVAVEVIQAAIGIAQYELGLPVALVALHLVGAGLLVAATASLVATTRVQQPAT